MQAGAGGHDDVLLSAGNTKVVKKVRNMMLQLKF